MIQEDIVFEGVLIASLLRFKNDLGEGLHFFSGENEGIQVGVWVYGAGKVLAPHIHNKIEKTSERTSEVILVLEGRIHADLYNDESELLREIVLEENDILICYRGGHGYRTLTSKTRVLEVKNGPYHGPEKDRRRIDSKCTEVEASND